MYNSIYPTYVKSYLGINNKKITPKQDDEKNSSKSSQNAENDLQEGRHRPVKMQNESFFPNGEKVAIDYTKKHIGIEQVLSDFRNTANAIGAPDEIKQEVAAYLTLIENQTQKENPNSQIIQANLKNASQILDEYITNTLKKPSKVVENWVDALFLQSIDYKSTKKENIEQTTEEPQSVETVNSEEQAAIVSESETNIKETPSTPAETSQTPEIYIPSDETLRKMFIQAKKYSAIDKKEKAIYAFQNAMDYAEEIGDYQTCATIHFEEGRLYDEFNQPEDALYNYDRAAKQSRDYNIKAKSHLYMGKIYDDYVHFKPAVEHYCRAVSLAGESDNLKLQTQALSDLARIHADKYDKENAFMFMNLAEIAASETDNKKVEGITYSKNARMCRKLGEKSKALSLFGNSANLFSQIEDNESLAKSYRDAAEIMVQYGNSAKAKKLLSKAYVAAYKTNNPELQLQIRQELANV